MKHKQKKTWWLLAMDVSALASMKDAAYCDKQCDLQNSEKH